MQGYKSCENCYWNDWDKPNEACRFCGPFNNFKRKETKEATDHESQPSTKPAKPTTSRSA